MAFHTLSLAVRRLVPTAALAIVLLALGAGSTWAEEYRLIIKDHKFQPEVLEVPAGERVKIIVENQDPTPEEFESHDLRREKIIPGNSSAKIWVGPLPEGEYEFFGEFNQDTALGKLIAK